MLDEMILSGLKVYAWHGVYEEEREKGQNFIINARIFYDTVSVAETDSVEDTIDYAKVSLYINEYMRVHQFNLIETVANKLARKLLIKFPLIQSIELEVMKPEAPIPVPFSNVSVRVNRGWHKVYMRPDRIWETASSLFGMPWIIWTAMKTAVYSERQKCTNRDPTAAWTRIITLIRLSA